MHEMGEHTDAVYPKILCEKLNIVVDIAIHAHPHVLEEPLVDVQHSLMYLLRQDRVHALVQSLGKQDLISDERRREIGEQCLYVF